MVLFCCGVVFFWYFLLVPCFETSSALSPWDLMSLVTAGVVCLIWQLSLTDSATVGPIAVWSVVPVKLHVVVMECSCHC